MKTQHIKDQLMNLPAPVETTTETSVHPEWVMGGNPRAIEAQEAQGQRDLVANTQLPVDCTPDFKAKLEAAGVIFGAKTPGDPLFCMATLPKGWKKQATDHSMWSDLVDDKGKKVAAIFYKAAFYDRSAFMREA